jgi:hypothetical protein
MMKPVDNDPVKMIEIAEEHGAVFTAGMKKRAQEANDERARKDRGGT